jgi:hypothetical protein
MAGSFFFALKKSGVHNADNMLLLFCEQHSQALI